MTIFVEVLDRRRQVAERVRLAAGELRIGRGYSNDLILDDRFVDPEHARILRGEDGEWRVEDRNSRNGVIAEGARAPVESLRLVDGVTFRVGRTYLRVRTSEHSVPPALLEAGRGPVRALLQRPLWALVAFVVMLGLAVEAAFLSTYVRIEVAPLAAPAIGLAIGTLLWVGVWAFASRVVVHEWRSWAHLGVSSLSMVVYSFLGAASAYFGMLVSVGSSQTILEAIAMFGIMGWQLDAHLSFASMIGRRHRVAISGAISAATLVLVLFFEHYRTSQFASWVEFPAELRPFPAAWLGGKSFEAFELDLADLEAELLELSRKE